MSIKVGNTVYDKEGLEYEIVSKLGSGGFSIVYKIRNTKDNKYYALKTLTGDFTNEEDSLALKNDAILASEVDHNNVIKYYYFHDGEEFNGLPPYIIMEYAEQGSLYDLLKRRKSSNELINIESLNRYFIQLIRGMNELNQILIHRDIKPQNILIVEDELKISDFGISKYVEAATRTKTFKGFGTLEYVAPEVWKNEKNTISMDIYSMGITFYEMATLVYPFIVVTSDYENWKNAHLYIDPRKPSEINKEIPYHIERIILKMIEKDKGTRYQSWSSIEKDINMGSNYQSKSSLIIDDIVKMVDEKEDLRKRKLTEEEQYQNRKQQYRDKIKSQFIRDIYNPLKKISDDFNSQHNSLRSKFDEAWSIDIFSFSLQIPSLPQISVNFLILHEDEHVIERIVQQPWDREAKVHKSFALPKYPLNNRDIMGWGTITTSMGKGVNLVFVKKDEDLSGDWLLLVNTNNAFVQSARMPEPFPFDLNEIEKEIKNINVMHIYDINVEPFNVETIINLIK